MIPPTAAPRTAASAIAIPRRRFLQGAAALGGAALFDQFVTPMWAATAVGTLRDIDHFILLMKENRSFDHYFGTLAGVRGFDDATATMLPDGRPIFAQTDNQDSTPVMPFRLDTTRTNAQRLQAKRLHERNYQQGLLRWKTEIKYPVVPKIHDLGGD